MKKHSTHSYIFSTLTAMTVGIVVASLLVRGKTLLSLVSHHVATDTTVYSADALAGVNAGLISGVSTSDSANTTTGTSSAMAPLPPLPQSDNEEDPIPALGASVVNDTSIESIGDSPKSGKPKVTAGEYLVIDLANHTPILQKNSNQPLPIASLTKLVTAVIATNVIPDRQRIEITPAALKTYGNTAHFKLGEIYNASDLYYPLLMVSSNDAAEAFADAYGRSQFIAAMNAWVYSIGAYHTHFVDPAGLSPQNVSSADDLALIAGWIYNHRPQIVAITHTKVKIFRTHVWTNPTHLLNLSTYVGGKNGYIPEAGLTAVSLFNFNYNGKVTPFAAIVLRSTNRDADILELLDHVSTPVAVGKK